MKRPSMTIRRWMAVVAIASLISLGVERVIAYRRIREHQALLARYRALKAAKYAQVVKTFRLKIEGVRHGGPDGGVRQAASPADDEKDEAEIEKASQRVPEAKASLAPGAKPKN